jgi:hypothetical protein
MLLLNTIGLIVLCVILGGWGVVVTGILDLIFFFVGRGK